jgi:hypothetical protein
MAGMPTADRRATVFSERDSHSADLLCLGYRTTKPKARAWACPLREPLSRPVAGAYWHGTTRHAARCFRVKLPLAAMSKSEEPMLVARAG